MASTTSVPEALEPKKNGNFKFAFTCAIFASMACIILGYDIGVMSGAALYIKEDLKIITDVQLEILIGVLNLYSLIGSFAAGRTSIGLDRPALHRGLRRRHLLHGRVGHGLRRQLRHACSWWVASWPASIGVGYAVMIAPVYTAEVSPAGGGPRLPDVTVSYRSQAAQMM